MTLQQKIWEIVEMHETQEAYWFDKFIITPVSYTHLTLPTKA